jgi:hypothetical protein
MDQEWIHAHTVMADWRAAHSEPLRILRIGLQRMVEDIDPHGAIVSQRLRTSVGAVPSCPTAGSFSSWPSVIRGTAVMTLSDPPTTSADPGPPAIEAII